MDPIVDIPVTAAAWTLIKSGEDSLTIQLKGAYPVKIAWGVSEPAADAAYFVLAATSSNKNPSLQFTGVAAVNFYARAVPVRAAGTTSVISVGKGP